MKIDQLIAEVREELGFPVTDSDLIEVFGDEEVEVDGEDERSGLSLEEHIGAGIKPGDESAGDQQGETSYESAEEMRTHFLSKRG